MTVFVPPTFKSTSVHQSDEVYSMSARYGCSVAQNSGLSGYQGIVLV